MKLNIGCGNDIWGDVRFDVTTIYRNRKIRNPPNFIGDARKLPFKNNSFGVVKASHIIDEIEDWTTALDEWMRVCKDMLVIKFPIADSFRRYLTHGIVTFCPAEVYSAIQCRRLGIDSWIMNPQIVAKYLERRGFMINVKRNKYRKEQNHRIMPIKNFGLIDIEYEIIARKKR